MGEYIKKMKIRENWSIPELILYEEEVQREGHLDEAVLTADHYVKKEFTERFRAKGMTPEEIEKCLEVNHCHRDAYLLKRLEESCRSGDSGYQLGDYIELKYVDIKDDEWERKVWTHAVESYRRSQAVQMRACFLNGIGEERLALLLDLPQELVSRVLRGEEMPLLEDEMTVVKKIFPQWPDEIKTQII